MALIDWTVAVRVWIYWKSRSNYSAVTAASCGGGGFSVAANGAAWLTWLSIDCVVALVRWDDVLLGVMVIQLQFALLQIGAKNQALSRRAKSIGARYRQTSEEVEMAEIDQLERTYKKSPDRR